LQAGYYGMNMYGYQLINGVGIGITIAAANLGDTITIEYTPGTKQVAFWKNGREWTGPMLMKITDEQALRVYPVIQLHFTGDAATIIRS